MNDWAPPLIAAALFWLLSPGMIFQLPGKNAPFEFMNMKTTVASMFVHTNKQLQQWDLIYLGREKERRKRKMLGTGSAGVDVNFKGHDEDGIKRKKDECVNENSFAVGLHAAEL
ncbi:hypothetical protein CR513_15562, partial [Mucuna pruriens]